MIGKAIAIIGGLREGLDPDKSEVSIADLDNLYHYMMTRLVEANLNNDTAILDEVSGLLATINDGWDAIAPETAPQF
ncbi:Flagellar protein FliS [compost metagenome]